MELDLHLLREIASHKSQIALQQKPDISNSRKSTPSTDARPVRTPSKMNFPSEQQVVAQLTNSLSLISTSLPIEDQFMDEISCIKKE